MSFEKGNTLKITKSDVTRKLKSVPKSGPDKIQGFWLKSFAAVHDCC